MAFSRDSEWRFGEFPVAIHGAAAAMIHCLKIKFFNEAHLLG
jgi:hypothetical protein